MMMMIAFLVDLRDELLLIVALIIDRAFEYLAFK